MALERDFTEQWRQVTERQHWRVITRAITVALQDFERVDEFVEQLAALIREELHYDHFGIGLLGDDGRLAYKGGYGLPEEWQTGYVPASGGGIVNWVLRHAQPLLLPDVRDDPRYIPARDATRSELCVPFSLRGKVLGVINAESDRLDAFTARDVELLAALTGILALRLEDVLRREGTAPIMRALTQRERVVLRLIANGEDDQQITRELQIAQSTLRAHVRAIFQKLRVNSRAHAVAWAHKHRVFRD